MGKLLLVLGGVRSGKSAFADRRAQEIGGERVLYVATSEAKDAEMEGRVRKHRQSRPAGWRTLEAPHDVAAAVRRTVADARVVLVDCLTVLVANRLVDSTGPYDDPFDDPGADPFDEAIEADIVREVRALADCARDLPAVIIVVSNEVGMGVVPPYDLGRAYRDLLGRANQEMARHADEVYLLVAGISLTIKGTDTVP
jgi:adenosylcobinamide kinase/adenosylcobinamide-phosphate guanylyltransferase